MNKIVFLLILLGLVGFYKSRFNADEPSFNGEADSSSSIAPIMKSHGFVKAFMPDGAKPNEVLIITPIHCTVEEVEIGKRLEENLISINIPAKRSERMDFSGMNLTSEQLADINKSVELFKSNRPPIVFINGYAKARPSVSDIKEVYELTN